MKKTFKEVVANELRALRARSNLKQKEVANIAGIDIMTVARYENNSVSMQLDMLEKILSVYNVPLNIFFINVSAIYTNKESRQTGGPEMKDYYNAKDVQQVTGVSKSLAYEIIKKLQEWYFEEVMMNKKGGEINEKEKG